jgi:AraC-like DNA-binding protein
MTSNFDALSDVLRTVQLNACIYFVKDMPAPWGMDIPAVANGPLHFVLEGSCVLVVQGKEIFLNAGDAVLLPHGTDHQMLDTIGTNPVAAGEVMENLLSETYQKPEVCATRMMCGHFEWDSTFGHPLFQELPELMVIRGVYDGHDAQQFKAILDLITVEVSDQKPGSSAVADRMGEVLFVSMLRRWLVDNKPEKGLLATIDNPRLSRALNQIHNSPEAALDLNVLSRTAGMSRTSFAVQFRDAMGIPPAEYLARWRMLIARRMLLNTDLATSDIVSRVGYGSDASFSRAFKREYGIPPSKVRHQGAPQRAN